MESFASWRSIAAEWRRKIDDRRSHFKEKMNQEEAHHHRKPWIRA